MNMTEVVRIGTDSSGRPILVTKYMEEWLDDLFVATRAFSQPFTPTIVQGGFMSRVPGGGAADSAGYHDLAKAIDFRTWNLTPGQKTFLVREIRRRGGASWIRDKAHGNMDEHLHMVLGPDKPGAPGANWQWGEYLAGRDGLSTRGEDYHWRPNPLVTTWKVPVPRKPTINISTALTAKDRDGRRQALERVKARGNPTASAAAASWLKAMDAQDRAAKRIAAARKRLKGEEVK